MQNQTESSEKGLTVTQEEAIVVEQDVPTQPLPIIIDPYNTEVPNQLVSRYTQVSSLVWSSGWTGASIAFPNSLTPTALGDVLKKYRYFRADVEIEIKVQSTPYHQGALIVGWISDWAVAASTPSALPLTNLSVNVDKYLLSGMNGIVLSAASQTSCKFIIPWRSPVAMHDTESTSLFLGGIIGCMFIRVLNEIVATQPNQATSVPVMVFARYINIKLAGFKSNSGKTSKEAHAKSQQFDAKTAVSTASKVARRLPVIGDAWGMIADTFNSLAGDLSKPTNTASAQPIVNQYLPQNSLAHGIEYAQPISLYPNAYAHQEAVVNGMETSHMEVAKLAQKPMLHATGIFSTSTTTMTLTCGPSTVQVTGCTLSPIRDWLHNVSLPFKYWRGSVKYKIHFVMPAFYSARARIYCDVQSTGIIDVADLPQQLIDLKGDTWVDFMIPYLYTTIWRDHRTDGISTQNARIHIDLVTSIMGSSLPTAPIIYVNIFRAGGEDTQFAQLRGVRNTGFLSDCSLETEFKKPFEGLIKCVQTQEQGICMTEVVKTISDCLKRPSSLITTAGTLFTHPNTFPAGTANVNWRTLGGEPFNYFAYMFRYWRGGRILTHTQAFDKVAFSNATANLSTHGDGVASMYTAATNSLANIEKVHVHWMCQVPYTVMAYTNNYYDFESYNDLDTGSLLYPSEITGVPNSTPSFTINGADDYMLIYPVPFFSAMFAPINFSVNEQREPPLYPVSKTGVATTGKQ